MWRTSCISLGDISESTVTPPSTQKYFLLAIGEGGKIWIMYDQQTVSLSEAH